MDAKAVVVTVAAKAEIDEIVRQVRALRADVVIVSRARDASHARHLYAIGVTDAVPETIEASLQLSEAALIGGTATGPVSVLFTKGATNSGVSCSRPLR
jgi:CPA2 family monovalent cation:H+ antiporter-2